MQKEQSIKDWKAKLAGWLDKSIPFESSQNPATSSVCRILPPFYGSVLSTENYREAESAAAPDTALSFSVKLLLLQSIPKSDFQKQSML